MPISIQILVSTMNQKDYSLLKKMNIQSDAIVVNQCDENKIEEFDYNGHKIKWISLAERGVGLSRNTALMRSTADVVLFADDDVVYINNYEDIVRKEYEIHSKCGLIVFNFESLNKQRQEYLDRKSHKLNWHNSLRYGAFRISIRREVAFKKNLTYSLLFGGGSVHQAGEDNLFVVQALQSGINAWASKEQLGTVAQHDSTWFKGYDEKYYFDRGFLFANMFGHKSLLLLFLLEIKEMHSKSTLPFWKRIKIEIKGMRLFRGR